MTDLGNPSEQTIKKSKTAELSPVRVGELYESLSGKMFKVILNATFGGSPMVVLKETSMEDGIIIGRLQFEELFKKHDPFKGNSKAIDMEGEFSV